MTVHIGEQLSFVKEWAIWYKFRLVWMKMKISVVGICKNVTKCSGLINIDVCESINVDVWRGGYLKG